MNQPTQIVLNNEVFTGACLSLLSHNFGNIYISDFYKHDDNGNTLLHVCAYYNIMPPQLIMERLDTDMLLNIKNNKGVSPNDFIEEHQTCVPDSELTTKVANLLIAPEFSENPRFHNANRFAKAHLDFYLNESKAGRTLKDIEPEYNDKSIELMGLFIYRVLDEWVVFDSKLSIK